MKVELVAYTKGINGESPEKVIELAGRTSYKSFRRVQPGSEIAFIKSIIENGHFSVLEHASASFRIIGISRACSHQLVRHRMVSFIQASQRYVDETNATFVTPPTISENKEAQDIYDKYLKYSLDTYEKLKKFKILKEDARFVLPNATTTEIYATANFREWRHIIGLRVSREAQWEIRELALAIWKGLYTIAPTVFSLESFIKHSDYKYKAMLFKQMLA